MLVDSHNHSLFTTLSLGSFPKDVHTLECSKSFLEQVIYVDYNLHATLQSIVPSELFHPTKSDQTQIQGLIGYIQSIELDHRYTNKSYLEVLYYSVVLAHLHVLHGDYDAATSTLRNVSVDHSISFIATADEHFFDYMSARYYSILGKVQNNGMALKEYFRFFRRYGSASQVSMNIWIQFLCKNILSLLSAECQNPIGFSKILAQDFASNICAIITLANYALQQEGMKFVTSSFRNEYLTYITDLLEKKTKQKNEFPDAKSENLEELDFVQSFFQTVPRGSIKPALLKRYLVSLTEKSYQSQSVLLNLIFVLLDLDEYDQAFAALKTYASYVERERVQSQTVSDVIQVIQVYSRCILQFSPTNSFILEAESLHKKFVHNTLEIVVRNLEQFSEDLHRYLAEVGELASLCYDDSPSDDHLSFLYKKYNPNVLLDNNSVLVTTLCDAWFTLGKLQEYFAIHDCPNLSILKKKRELILTFEKNSLIINASGNINHLFSFALNLAHEHFIEESLKLCKFILKRFPESFRTWNLLALVTSASDITELSKLQIPHVTHEVNAERMGGILDQNIASHNGDISNVSEAVKYTESALNIASIFITKSRDSNSSILVQENYEILQLKMTQLAIREWQFGVESVLEDIPEIFVLYRDLFHPAQFSDQEQNGRNSKLDTKCSHRPSVVGPSGTDNVTRDPVTPKQMTKEKIKRLSKISVDNTRKNARSEKSEANLSSPSQRHEARILQEIWLWTASFYLKLGIFEEAEQCIMEAEVVDKPNASTHAFLGFLTSKSRKSLALLEYETSFEIFHTTAEKYNRKAYRHALVGMSQLLIPQDENTKSLFVSQKDRDAALVRLKNYLETYTNCWPYGHNCSEVWYYLSEIYEKFDDEIRLSEALWKCVDLESNRPVRAFDVCEDLPY